jgi:hypothetical protein
MPQVSYGTDRAGPRDIHAKIPHFRSGADNPTETPIGHSVNKLCENDHRVVMNSSEGTMCVHVFCVILKPGVEGPDNKVVGANHSSFCFAWKSSGDFSSF